MAQRFEPFAHVPYPQWWLDQAAQRRRAIDAALDAYRKALRDAPDVCGALVFGSAARGDIGPKSDIDLIVLVESPLPWDQRWVGVMRALPKPLPIPVDLLVWTPAEFEELCEMKNFYDQALREGRWLVERTPS